MQRRAAAIYATFFLIIGVGSYALIATANQPDKAMVNSLWSIVAICGLTVVFLLSMAYLPSRY
ncbi:hypothetical protein [Halegenticoccus tardaugens]|uniref:hypothetical protein n=1 Tax=Halegenticoccus tardaugens TaxID=2071624 RepID=UPI00100BC42A|nr:hypothetical protein [Halegenticoccus tardaugens]